MSYETQPAIAGDSEFDFEKLLTEIRKLVAWRCPIHTERRIETPRDVYESVLLIVDALDEHRFQLRNDNQASASEFSALCRCIHSLYVQKMNHEPQRPVDRPIDVRRCVETVVRTQQATIDTLGRLFRESTDDAERLRLQIKQLQRELADARDIPCG